MDSTEWIALVIVAAAFAVFTAGFFMRKKKSCCNSKSCGMPEDKK